MKKLFWIISLAAVCVSPQAQTINWPNGEQVAISLSYDDALDSQLDNAIPALNEYNLQGSFYLTLASPVTHNRLAEWRGAVKHGHELGNHTIYHPCSKSQPGTDWVLPYNDMDKRTTEQMRGEVMVANAYLHAIDGKNQRTFTPPCGHTQTANGDYLPAVQDLFVSIKGAEQNLPKGFSLILGPNGHSGEEIIEIIQQASQHHKLIQLIFHGIGGDHLSVSSDAHRELLRYLNDNRDIYWTDTYMNIAQHLQSQQ